MTRPDEKDEVLRLRISKQDKQWFTDICERQGQVPAEVMRNLVHEFCNRYQPYEEALCEVTAWKPQGYDWGAYRVKAVLSDKIADCYSVQFKLPELPRRNIVSDEGYIGAIVDSNTGKAYRAGVFRNHIWEGHIYSNGMPEDVNDTHKDEVVRKIRGSIEIVAKAYLPGSSILD